MKWLIDIANIYLNDVSFIFEFKNTVIFSAFDIKPIREQIGKAMKDSGFPSFTEKELLVDKLIFLIEKSISLKLIAEIYYFIIW